MTIASMQLDPNAQTYADLSELDSTAATKLSGISDGAEVNPADLAALDPTQNTKLDGIATGATTDQTGTEMQTAILALADADRKLIRTDPQTNEFTVLAIQRDATGKLDVTYDDTAN